MTSIVGGRRRQSALSSDLLCAFHTKQQLLSSRSPCPRRGGQAELPCGGVVPAPTPHAGDSPQQARARVCQAAYAANAGQPGAAPLRPGWLGALQRFWYYYKEIIQRAALTLGLLVVIRCGSFIPVPGVDLAAVPAAAATTAGERLIKALYGQAQDIPASLFDLGISPFVNASIVMAITLVLPQEVSTLPGMGWLGRLRDARKEGRTGEATINSASHTLALGFAVYAALVRALELEPCALAGAGGLFGFVPLTMLALVAGSCCIHMCASTITAFGLGNGSSLVICAGIITEYANTLHTVLAALDTALLAPGRLLAVLGGYLALVLGCVWLATSELRLPVVQYAASAPPPPDTAKSPGGGGLQELIAQARLLGQRKSAERAALSSGGAGGGGVRCGGYDGRGGAWGGCDAGGRRRNRDGGGREHSGSSSSSSGSSLGGGGGAAASRAAAPPPGGGGGGGGSAAVPPRPCAVRTAAGRRRGAVGPAWADGVGATASGGRGRRRRRLRGGYCHWRRRRRWRGADGSGCSGGRFWIQGGRRRRRRQRVAGLNP